LKKIYDVVDRFCATHPRFGIPNLMRVVTIGTVAVYALYMLLSRRFPEILTYLVLSLGGLMQGRIWTLVTFPLVPSTGSLLSLAISLYFYYWIGSTLERRWGTAKFNLYYFGGVVLTVIGTLAASLISGNPYLFAAGTEYVNLSMFLAFALLFPDTTVLLFFVIPVKMKWLAILDGALFLLQILSSLIAADLAGVVLPVVALLNFAIFVWPEVLYFKQRQQYRHSPQAVQFKKAVQQQKQQRGYVHKCSVCGKTDTDYPDLQFRYCSKCAGYHCFCQDHIFSHTHYTGE